MSDPVLVALIVAAGPLILGLVNLALTRTLEKKVNSRLDQLVAQAEKIAHAAGVQEERNRGSEDS